MPLPTDLIYHYCGTQGFEGIIRTRKLWLSSIFFMNDSLEWYWLQDLILSRINEMSKTASGHAPAVLQQLRERFSRKEPNDTYCCCFSERGDDLGQWRSYAADATGFSLGFSRREISEAIPREQRAYLQLSKIVYDPDSQRQIVDRALAGVELLGRVVGAPTDLNLMAAEVLASHQASSHAAVCKNPAFEREDEWRLIYSAFVPMRYSGRMPFSPPPPIGPVEFRVRAHQIIPYFKCGYPLGWHDESTPKLPVTALRHIVLGPRNREPENEFSVRLLLERNGFDVANIAINHSAASYR